MIKKILLTGDDGYNSLGTRLLINALADKYELTVVGTKKQQSGVGAALSLKNGFQWGEDEVDGVKAIWVDGTPADGAEFASYYFDQPFDLVISGINWGANLGTSIISSGTFGAVMRGSTVGIFKKAIAISWDLSPENYFIDHSSQTLMSEYIDYPGKIISKLLDLVIANDFWNAQILNVNLPQQLSDQVRLTHLHRDIKDIYDFDRDPFFKNKHDKKSFSFAGSRLYDQKLPADSDVQAMNDGVISITPCRDTFTDEQLIPAEKTNQFSL